MVATYIATIAFQSAISLPLVSAGSDPTGYRIPLRPLGSEKDFQGFLARVSEKVRFSPILRPHLVEYLFIQPFSHSQRFINYRVDTALLCVLFCVFLYLFIQKLFRVENRR